MAGPFVMTLEGKAIWLLLWSPYTELFTLELYLEDGLEMGGPSAVTLERDFT